MKSIVPVFIALVSLYVLYRTYNVHQNYILIEEGREVTAKIKFRNLENHSLIYMYEVDNQEYTKSEVVDMQLYNEKVPGDLIQVFVKRNNPESVVIKDNKKAFSYISLGMNASSNPVIVPLWVGYMVGILLLLFGVIQFLRKYRRTPKTFD